MHIPCPLKENKASREHKPGVTVHIYNQETNQKHKFKACLDNLDPVSKGWGKKR